MTRHTIMRGVALVASRLVAFVAGCIFVAGAGALLFQDVVLAGAALKLPHILTIVTLSGTLLVGHLMGEAWRGKHWLRSVGFGLLFVVGTLLVVYQSSGKQAETTFASQAEADKAAEDRAKAKAAKDKAQIMLDGEMLKLGKEAGSGCLKRCLGIKESIAVYQAAVKGHQADLDRLGPAKPLEPEAENIANVAAVFGVEKAKVKAGAILVVPFIRTILFELGGLWCLGFAFRPLPRSETQETEAEKPATRQPSATETAQTSFHADDIEATRATILGGPTVAETPRDVLPFARRNPGNWGNGGNRRGPKPDNPRNGRNRPSSRVDFERDVVTRLALGQSIDSQDELAEAHHVNKGTASKWLKDMRQRGLIPAAQRVGRCHRLTATASD